MTLILSGDITLRRTWQPMDPDAAAYITAVETADGQALEEKVKIAIDNFVLGCKADGIWDAIKASCILAGARTLNGALTPLTGTAPANYNFVAGDYNRKTGLGSPVNSTKYLNSNVLDNSNPQNNKHLSVYTTNNSTLSLVGALALSPNSFTWLRGDGSISASSSGTLTPLGQLSTVGLQAVSRSSSANFDYIFNQAVGNVADNSVAGNSLAYFIFARNINGAPSEFCKSKIAFYSIGEALDLALLDARVTDLINKFAEVIP